MPAIPSASLCDSGLLPLGDLVPILAREATRPKAIYQTHKWFARRLGSAFRALLVGLDSSTTEEFWTKFYSGNAAKELVVLDPFVGGGTSVIEAHRLGYRALGVDIDPAPVAITSFEASLSKQSDLADELLRLKGRMREKIAAFYGCEPDWTGAVPIHFFWVQVVTCSSCEKEAECHPSYIVARDKASGVQWVYDPDSKEIEELPLKRKRMGSGRRIADGTVQRGCFCCPNCGTSTRLIETGNGGPPRWHLFCIEETNSPRDGRTTPNRDRRFRSATATDRQHYENAARLLQTRVRNGFLPQDSIPVFPSGDSRLHSYGYERFTDLFNARQLLHLGLLAEEIKCMPADTRGAFAIAFSDHLTTNCMLTHYASDWRRLCPLFSIRAYRHICRPVELNPWLDGTGRGTFPNAIRSIAKAKEALISPKEATRNGGFASIPFDVSEAIKSPVQVVTADSRDLAFIKGGSVDIVLTDPPYFGNIAYGELSAFFKPWMRHLGLIQQHETEINAANLGTVNSKSTENTFEDGLLACFQEVRRVLKADGRLLFTFQNASRKAWLALERAIIGSDLEVVSSFPLLGERPEGLHKHTNSISWDAVFVCRPALSQEDSSRIVGLEHFIEEKTEAVKSRLNKASSNLYLKADEENYTQALRVWWTSLHSRYVSPGSSCAH